MKQKMTPSERTKAIGQRIREWREAQAPTRWTVAELAKACRPEQIPSRISNYEQGTRRPDLEAAEILATAMGTSAAHLLLLDDEQPVLSPAEAEVINNLRSCSPELRDALIKRIRVAAEADAPLETETAKVLQRLQKVGAKHKNVHKKAGHDAATRPDQTRGARGAARGHRD